MSKRHSPHADRVSLVALAIALLAFALRVHSLAYDAIWWDEGYSVWISHLPLQSMVVETARDVHPPLYYALLHIWMYLAGQTELVIRLPSVFFGVLSVMFIYRAGWIVGGRPAGAGAALLAAVGPVMVRWSQETRMHTLAACLTALALWSALHLLLIDRHRWRWAAIFGAATVAVLYTLYLAAGAILAIDLGLALVFIVRKEHRWKWALPWLASQVGALLVFLPWAWYVSHRVPIEPLPVHLSFLPFLDVYAHVALLGLAENLERYRLLFVAALILSGIALVATARDGRRLVRTAWIVLLVGAVLPPIWLYGVFSIPRAQNFNNVTPSARYAVSLAAPLYVLLGWGSASLGRSRQILGAVFLAGLVGMSSWPLDAYYRSITPGDDYRTLAATLDALRQPGDVVLLNNDRDWPAFWYRVPDYRSVTYTQVIQDDAYASEVLNSLAGDSPGVWLVQTPFAAESDPQARLVRLLEQDSTVYRYDMPDVSLTFYARTTDRARTAHLVQQWPAGFQSVEAVFAEDAALAGYTSSSPVIRRGFRLGVGLGWQVEAGSGQYPVALKLLARDGSEIASVPVVISSDQPGRYFQPVSLLVPGDAPIGRAQLLFVAGSTWQPLGRVRILPANRTALQSNPIPADAQPLGIRFGDSLELVAASLPEETTFGPGETVPLTLYWRANGPVPDAYKVFVHITNSEPDSSTSSSIWGQQDQIPGGTAPTSSWLTGDQVIDSYNVLLDSSIPSGVYAVQVGLYQPSTGQRLPAISSDGVPLGDSAVILTIEIP